MPIIYAFFEYQGVVEWHLPGEHEAFTGVLASVESSV
jgi:hypothetical protein